MTIAPANDQTSWDAFLGKQQYRPFLQSWTMGEVYEDVGQVPIRIVAKDGEEIIGICYGHIVPARRGKHIAIPYGPILDLSLDTEKKANVRNELLRKFTSVAKEHNCTFLRWSPFFPEVSIPNVGNKSVSSPLHLLAEHVWYVPLTEGDAWQGLVSTSPSAMRTEDSLLMAMRKTTRNLIRRAEKDGVTIEKSTKPEQDLENHFIRLHDETRKRHKFTPYTNAFFRAQVKHFAPRGECTVYLAKYQGEVIAASLHMHAFGETSYHHGSSSSLHNKIPASYLLQWRAIQDAMKRGDHVYNFWGVAPLGQQESNKPKVTNHPFAGVTLFKTGFGGSLLNLMHCRDIPVSKMYWLTYGFEVLRKWKRGF